MKKYFTLVVPADPKKRDFGPSVFYDTASGLKVLSKDEKNPDPAEGYEGSMTKKILAAITNGHIKEVSAPGSKAAAKEEASTPTAPAKELSEMDEMELLAYYKENFEVKKKDLETFAKMTTEEKVAFLSE